MVLPLSCQPFRDTAEPVYPSSPVYSSLAMQRATEQHSCNTRRDQSRCAARARRCEGRGARENRRRVQWRGGKGDRRSSEARSAEVNRKGEARLAEPSCHSFLLRPIGPKVEARRAEAKFWVWLICWATVESPILDRPKSSCQSVFRRKLARHAAVNWSSPWLPVTQECITAF